MANYGYCQRFSLIYCISPMIVIMTSVKILKLFNFTINLSPNGKEEEEVENSGMKKTGPLQITLCEMVLHPLQNNGNCT